MRILNSLPIPATWLALIALVAPAGAQFDVDPYEIFDRGSIDFQIPREAVQAKGRLDQGNNKIDPALRTLMEEAAGQGRGAFAAQAKGRGVPLGDAARTVSVALTPDRGSTLADLRAAARDYGAEVTVDLAGVVYASVPLDRVEALGAAGELHYLAPQAQYYPSYPALAAGSIATDGVQSVGADRLHDAGITGRGVKIGILDYGFQGYSALQAAGQLPRPKAKMAFNNSRQVEAESVHGTACAEIVHAMAPDADLYLAAVSGREDQMIQAARWLAAQGVDIVSHSGGGHWGPHNGNSRLDKLVEEISDKHHILWVNAAGNEGALHWGGSSTDYDRDGFVEMGPNGENYMVVQAAGDGIDLMVTWDDWGPDPARPTATQDLNAYLFPYDPRTGTYALPPTAVSVNPQGGRGRPIEHLRAQVPRGSYILALHAMNVTRQFQVHVYSSSLTGSTPPAQLTPSVPAGSIAIPATSAAALAVGAVDVHTEKLEAFSSNGPTDDGRIKPDVSAPDKTRSAAYNGPFPGTSAACPHVSGFAALLKEHYGARNQDLAAYITQATRAMGGARNNRYGFGHIDASKLGGRIGITGTVTLPGDWGGEIEVNELDAQLAAARSGRDLDLKVVVGRSEYRIGDGLKIGITAERACYYLLLGRDEQGNFAVISPLGDDRPRLRAGEKRAFPERGTIRVTGPPGRDEVILIGSREPLDPRNWRSSDSVSVARASYRVVR